MLLDQLKKLSNVLIKKIDKIEIEPNRCLKVRAVASQCSSCIDVCPVGSIEITQDLVEIKDSCMNCGLCTAVCLTNALKWNQPPLIQILNQIKRLALSEPKVYIGCATSLKGTVKTNLIEVSCLGMLPIEFWLSLGKNIDNLAIIHRDSDCRSCKICEGERLFFLQKGKAEEILDYTFPVENSWRPNQKDDPIDHNRRRFLTNLFEEAKETNTITIKEALEVEKTMSPYEKFYSYHKVQSEMDEIVETAQEIKMNIVDKLLNETVIHTDKRAILMHEFKEHPELQKQITVSIPNIDESCPRCGACAFLCPTDALIMYNQSMILSTSKCVSCGLCEEICYERHIQMVPRNGTILNEKYSYLLR